MSSEAKLVENSDEDAQLNLCCIKKLKSNQLQGTHRWIQKNKSVYLKISSAERKTYRLTVTNTRLSGINKYQAYSSRNKLKIHVKA